MTNVDKRLDLETNEQVGVCTDCAVAYADELIGKYEAACKENKEDLKVVHASR